MSTGDALGPRVDIHRLVPQERDEGHPGFLGELHGEARRRGYRRDHRYAGEQRFLYELEAGAS